MKNSLNEDISYGRRHFMEDDILYQKTSKYLKYNISATADQIFLGLFQLLHASSSPNSQT